MSDTPFIIIIITIIIIIKAIYIAPDRQMPQMRCSHSYTLNKNVFGCV